MAEERLRKENTDMFSSATLEFIYPAQSADGVPAKRAVSDTRAMYLVRKKKRPKQRV
jgi:hypothetical protein